MEPENPDYLLNRGLCYMDVGRIKDAVYDYTKALKINGKLVDGYILRAAAYDAMGLKDKAKADMAEALKLNPNLPVPENLK